jgi:hypothetical protein
MSIWLFFLGSTCTPAVTESTYKLHLAPVGLAGVADPADHVIAASFPALLVSPAFAVLLAYSPVPPELS